MQKNMEPQNGDFSKQISQECCMFGLHVNLQGRMSQTSGPPSMGAFACKQLRKAQPANQGNYIRKWGTWSSRKPSKRKSQGKPPFSCSFRKAERQATNAGDHLFQAGSRKIHQHRPQAKHALLSTPMNTTADPKQHIDIHRIVQPCATSAARRCRYLPAASRRSTLSCKPSWC